MGRHSIEIRRAEPGDATRLTEIAMRAKAHWGYPPEWLALWRDQLVITPEYVRDTLMLVASDAGEIVGCCAAEPERSAWSLEHMWVWPPSMGHGVGRALLERLLAALGEMGGVLRIVSDPHASGFYERLGARRVGRESSLPRGRTLPVYEIDIPAPGVRR